VAELQNASNDIVRRAAAALEVVGNQKSIPALIEALVTKHRYKVRVADTSSTYAFSTDGSYIGSGTPTYLPPDIEVMLRTGQLPYGVSVYVPEHPIPTRVVTVSREQQNSEVLAALRKITEQDFGYDVRSWRLWWASKKLNTSPDSAGP